MTDAIQSLVHDGFTLKYRIKGVGSHTVIVIGSHIYYPRVFSANLENSLTLIYMDHRGFASKVNETTQTDFELEKLLNDIECLRLKLKQDKITLIGHSIHALLALEYTKKYPKHVDKLILSAASPIAGEKLYLAANKYFEESVDPVRKKIFTDNLNAMEARIKQNSSKAFIIRMLTFGPMLWYNPSFDATNLWKDVKLDLIGSHIIWNTLFSDYEIPDISHINISVLLLLGRYDYFNPPYLWENHRSKFKNLTIRVFEKSGHTPSLEQPDLFHHELLQWMQQSV
jgi:proline iminopeptidase